MLASHYAPGKPVRLGAAAFADEEFGIGFGAIAGDYDLSAAGDLTEAAARLFDALHAGAASAKRSEEHTSELQSLMRISYAVFCLKKKKSATTTTMPHNLILHKSSS